MHKAKNWQIKGTFAEIFLTQFDKKRLLSGLKKLIKLGLYCFKTDFLDFVSKNNTIGTIKFLLKVFFLM